MKRHVTAVVVGTLIWSTVTPADDPLTCVDADIVEALLRGPAAASPKISRDWSPRVPRISLPAEFTLIGSRTLPYTAIVSLETGLTPDAAMSQLDRAMTSAAWDRFEPQGPPAQRGFQVSRPVGHPAQGTYCKENLGIVSSAVQKSRRGTTYLMLITTRQSLLSSCVTESPPLPWDPSRSRLPVLRFPEAVTVTGGERSGSAGDGGEATAVSVESAMTGTALLDYFGRQLTEQGWRRGAQWSGTHLSGSSWDSMDEPLIGLLTIIARGHGGYDLAFETLPSK